jgi:hypothetical protein
MAAHVPMDAPQAAAINAGATDKRATDNTIPGPVLTWTVCGRPGARARCGRSGEHGCSRAKRYALAESPHATCPVSP